MGLSGIGSGFIFIARIIQAHRRRPSSLSFSSRKLGSVLRTYKLSGLLRHVGFACGEAALSPKNLFFEWGERHLRVVTP